MKRILVTSCLAVLMAANGFAAGKDPEVKMIDGKVSVQADAVTLKQFLDVFGAATGMTYKLAPELANQKFSVRLEGLDLDAAIRKSFQGQPWNYAIAGGKITVIDRAAAVSAPAVGGAPLNTSAPIQPVIDTRNDNPPPPVPGASTFVQPAPVAPTAGGAPSQPAAAINLPPAQGGAPAAPAAPAPLFQGIGTPLGGALPSAQPAR